MTTRAILYYEVHVTLDPVNELRIPLLKSIAGRFNFRLANLIMRKGGSVHTDDMFLTTRGQVFEEVAEQLREFTIMLTQANFHVRRYKIEDTLIDSAIDDSLQLIVKENEGGR